MSPLFRRSSSARPNTDTAAPVRKRKRPPVTRLGIEVLEDRLCPTAITAAQQTAILDGFSAFQAWGTNIQTAAPTLSAALPAVGTSVGSALDLGARFAAKFTTPATNYFATDTTPTFEELGTALTGVTVTPSVNGTDVTLVLGDFSFANTTTVGFDYGSGATPLGLTFDANAKVDLAATGKTTVTLYVGATATDFAVGLTGTTFGVSASSAALNFGATLSTTAPASSLSVVNGSFDLTADLTGKLSDPNADGKLDYAELTGAGKLGLMTFTAGSSSFAAKAPLTGTINGFASLGGVTVAAADPNLFDAVAPDVTASFNLTAPLRTQILNTLAEVATVGQELAGNAALDTVLPVVGKSVNELVTGSPTGKAGDILDIQSAVQTYFTANGDNSTLAGLLAVIQTAALANLDPTATGDATFGPVRVTGGLDFATKTLSANIAIDAGFASKTTVSGTSLTTEFGSQLDSLAVSISGSADIDLAASFKANATVGIDLTDFLSTGTVAADKVFVQVASAEAAGNVAATGIDLTGKAGFIEGSIAGGTLDLNPTATIDVAGGSKLTLADLAATPIANQTTITLAGGLDLKLPLVVVVGSFTTNAPTIRIADADVFDNPPGPAVTLENFDQVAAFRDLSPYQMLDLLVQFGEWLGKYNNSAVFQTEIPFTDQTVGSTVALATAFTAEILDAVSDVSTDPDRPGRFPKFATFDELLVALADAIRPAGPTYDWDFDPRYDPVAKEFTFRIKYTTPFAPLTTPFAFDLDFGDLGGLSSSTTLSLGAEATLDATIGVKLTRLGNPVLAGSPSVTLPTNGQLGALSSFTVNVDGSAKTVTISKAATDDNATVADLLADIRAALVAAGLPTTTVAASLAGTGTRQKVQFELVSGNTIQITADQADPFVTKLGFPTTAAGKVNYGELFVQDVGVTGKVTASAQDLIGKAQFGFVGIDVGSPGAATPDILGELTFGLELRDDADATPTRFTIGELSKAIQTGIGKIVQTDFNGLIAANLRDITISGGALGVAVNGSATVTLPNAYMGFTQFNTTALPAGGAKFDGDARFQVEVRSLAGTVLKSAGVTVTSEAMADNATTADLIADVEAALAAAGVNAHVRAVATPDGMGIVLESVDPLATAFTANGLVISQLTGFDDVLDSFRNMSFADVVQLIADVANRLQTTSDFAFLGDKLPLIEKSPAELLDLAAQLAKAAEDLQKNPAGSIQLLQTRLDALLGYTSGGNPIQLGWDAVNKALTISFVYIPASYSNDLSVNIDLQRLIALAGTPPELANVAGFVDVGGSGTIEVDAKAVLTLDLGLVLGDGVENVRPIVYTTSGISLLARAGTTNLTFQTTVGPLGVYVRNGRAAIDGDGDATTTDDYVEFRYGLDPGAGDFVEIADFAANLQPTVTGKAGILLPLFAPSPTLPLGGGNPANNKLGVRVNDLVSFYENNPVTPALTPTVEITSLPDIASLFSGLGLFDLLSNPNLVLGGIDNILSGIQLSLSSDLFDVDFPVIGDLLKAPGLFIEDFRLGLLSDLRAYIGGLPTLGELIDNIRLGFLDILGPAGFDILLDWDGIPGITIDDIGINLSGNILQFDLHLGQIKTFSFPAGFDLGLDAIGLSLDADVDLEFGWQAYLGFGLDATKGFFLDTTALGKNGGKEFTIDFKASVDGTAQGRLGFLQIDAATMSDPLKPTQFAGQFAVDILDTGTGANQDGRLTISEFNARGSTPWIEYGPNAKAEVNLALTASTTGGAVLPKLLADFYLTWEFDPNSGLDGKAPDFGFRDVRLDLGSFLTDFVKPIVDRINEYLEPIDPVLDIMLDPLPVISDLSGEDVSLLKLALVYNGLDPDEADEIVNAINFVRGLITDIAALGPGDSIVIPFGDFTLGGFDPRGQSDTKSATVTTSANAASLDAAFAGGSGKSSSIANSLRDNSGQTTITVPLLKDPLLAFDLLLGRDITIVEVEIPAIDISFEYEQKFPIFGPIEGNVRASFELYVGGTFGYDTTGFRKYLRTGRITDTLDGFYIVADPARPNVHLGGELSVGAGFDAGIVSAGVNAGIGATIDFYLNDPNKDGKMRAKELDMILRYEPDCLFAATGRMYARLFAWYEYFFGLGGDEITIVDIDPIIEFNFTCDMEPRLADDVGADGVLRLNAGLTAEDRLWGNTEDGDESYRVEDLGGGTMKVIFTDEDGFEQEQTFTGVTEIRFDGGAGNDVLDARGVTVPVYATGGGGNNTLIGGSANDELDGGDGNSVLDGGGGDDILIASAGLHKIAGGAGTDTLRISGNANYQFSQTAFQVGDFVGAWKLNAGDDDDPVEVLDVTGGDDGNKFDLTGWTGEATLDGADGADTIIAADNVDYTLADDSLERTGVPTIQLSSIEKTKLTGGVSDNSFTVTDWTGSGSIAGGGGTDTIAATNDVDFFLTDSSLDRTNRKSLSLTGVENATLTGGAARNTFDITDWTGTGAIDGAGGTDTVAEVNDFHYILTDARLTRSGGGDMTLAAVENATLTGGDSENTFTVSGWSGTGVINGDDGRDDIVAVNDENFTLTDTSLNRSGGPARGGLTLGGLEYGFLVGGGGANTFDVTGWTGLGLLAGGAGGDSVVSTGNADFTLTADGYHRTTGGRFTVTGIETANLTGGAADNTFTVDGWAGNGAIDGQGGGANSLVVKNDTNTLLSDTTLQRTGSGDFALTNLQNAALVGGEAGNSFVVSGWTGSGVVQGNGGTDQVAAGGDYDTSLSDAAIRMTSGGQLSLTGVEQASLAGGAGDNQFNLSGWTGDAAVSGGGGFDVATVSADGDFALGSAGLTVSTGATVDLAGVERVELLGGTGDNNFDVSGWEGDALVYGGAGRDAVTGVFNGDVVLADDLTGTRNGAGNPTVALVGVEEAVLAGGPGDQTFDVSGWTGRGWLVGGGGTDTVVAAGNGAFRLAADQLLTPAGGRVGLTGFTAAVLTGGTGADTFDLSGWTHAATVAGNGGADEILVFTDASFTLADGRLRTSGGLDAVLSGVEAAYLTGGLADTEFDVTGWTGRATLDGGGGNDTVYLGVAADAVRLSDTVLAASNGLTADLFRIRSAVLNGTPGDDTFDLSGWTGVARVFGNGATTRDVVNYVGDYDYILTNVRLDVSNGAVVWLADIADVVLAGGAAANVFDVSGWTHRASLVGLGGTDEVRATADADFTLADTLLTTSRGGLFNLSGVELARLTGGDSANQFRVADWHGTATLDGAGGGDDYGVVFHGTGAGTTAVTDTGLTGTDRLTVVAPPGGTLVRTPTRVALAEDDEWVDFAGVELIDP